MKNIKTLILAMSTISLTAVVMPAHAATDAEVDALRKEVSELKQLVQQLSNQQKAVTVVNTPKVPSTTIAASSPVPQSKPGWMQMPDGQTQVKLYGNVRVDATYDSNGSISNGANYPLNKDDPRQDSLNVSAATTRIGLDLTRPTQYGDLTGKIEADFMGGNGDNGSGTFRVRHAYMSLGKWLAGQTTSPFVNTDTSPETLDFTGAVGTGTTRTVQVRYTQPINAQQKILVALEGGDVEKVSNAAGGSRFPALTTRYDFKTADNKGLLQLHGLAHENRVAPKNSSSEEKFGWGVGIGGKYDITPQDSVVANYYHVKGDGRYLSYSNSAYAYDTTTQDINLGEFDSAVIGYQRKWSPILRSTFAIGGIQYKDDNVYANSNLTNTSYNKEIYNALVNLIWNPVKNIDLGAEYTYGQRETFAGDKGDYSRINLLAKYNF
ncbi:DcaP-like protein [Acinetobacter baumannii]